MIFHRRSNKDSVQGTVRKEKFKLDKQARKRIDREFGIDDGGYDFIRTSAEDYVEKPKRKWLRKLIIWLIVISVAVIALNIGILLYTGQLWFNEPRKRDYPIRGPVVSESLGKVNWEKFAQQNIQMAYIRATKSTAYEDESFAQNKSGAQKTDLPVGALHIFDIKLDGSEQAEHFAEVAGDMDGWLIPAVEVKLTGIYRFIPVDYDEISDRLLDFCDEIYNTYGVYPIIKCNQKIYENVASRGEFSECRIWYESQFSEPDDEVEWDFWGYSNRVRFNYYESGDYLEMTLFNGSEEDFNDMYI